MYFDDVLKDAREEKLAGKRDDELHAMLTECGNHLGHHSDTWTANQIPNAIKAIRHELSSRQLAKEHEKSNAEQQRLHQEATKQGRTLHGETMDELPKSKLQLIGLGIRVGLIGQFWPWELLLRLRLFCRFF
jgi:hypothetical protein